MGCQSYVYREGDSPHSPWKAVSRLAGRHFGIASVAQLHALGVDRQHITRWLAEGRLYQLHRGVYAIGHLALGARSRELAAVLACGPDALQSHRSAAAAHNLIRPTARIEVTAPRSRVGHDGFILHRSRCLEPQDRTEVRGIPTTTVARTLVDLAEVVTHKQLADAVHQAEVQRLFDLNAVNEVQMRLSGRTGRHLLSRVLSRYEPSPRLTRSEGEGRLLRLCEDHGLPMPETQVALAGYEIDCLWREAGLAVEFDGGAFHHTVRAYYDDRLRDRKLRVAGIQVIRVTWQDLEEDPADLVADLRDLL